jgi:glycosyltransferase involved in cell wall biosynthesis
MPLHGVGGLERAVRDLVRHLAARAVEVTLITPPAGHGHQVSEDPFASPNVRVRHVPYTTFPGANRRGTTVLDRSTSYLLFGLRAGRLARALVADGQIDLVHGHGASVLGYARHRSTAGAPLVFNPHGLEEFGGTGAPLPPAKRLGYAPLRRAVRTCARAADRVLCTDTSIEPAILKHLGIDRARMRTVPNGIDLSEAGNLAGPPEGAILRQRNGIAAGETVLVSAGRLERNKGFDVLAEALGRATGPDSPLVASGWRWIVVGSGPYRREIEKAVTQHGLDRHVIFTGRVSEHDLHAWYEAASLFVHPTRYEGSSLVTLEAMAHRKAVVATRVGGLPDKVRPGENGWLVEADDAGALADTILTAARDPIGLRRMGARSRAIVEQEFAWATLVDRQLAVYDEVLGRPGGTH